MLKLVNFFYFESKSKIKKNKYIFFFLVGGGGGGGGGLEARISGVFFFLFLLRIQI